MKKTSYLTFEYTTTDGSLIGMNQTLGGLTFADNSYANGLGKVRYVGSQDEFTADDINKVIAVGNGVSAPYSDVYCMPVSIPKNTFEGCGKMTSLIIPSNVFFIDPQSLDGCGNLKTIVFNGEEYTDKNKVIEVINKGGAGVLDI